LSCVSGGVSNLLSGVSNLLSEPSQHGTCPSGF
jgi:hypothetical protein